MCRSENQDQLHSSLNSSEQTLSHAGWIFSAFKCSPTWSGGPGTIHEGHSRCTWLRSHRLAAAMQPYSTVQSQPSMPDTAHSYKFLFQGLNSEHRTAYIERGERTAAVHRPPGNALPSYHSGSTASRSENKQQEK